MKTMYPGKINSPETKLTSAIGEVETVISVQDASVFPDAPNICTIGVGDDAETIRYAAKTENSLSGCERGFQGTAKSWQSGETISRNFTEYDYAALMEHIEKNAADITTHKHAIADVNGLQEALDSKSDSAHNHDSAYLGIDAKAKDSAKLGGHLPSYFAKNSDLTAHDGKKVSDVEGVHGLRYQTEQETLQYHDGSDWVDISGGSTKYPPGNVTGLSIEAKNRKLILKWSDPENTVVEGIVLSEWAGTKVVYKAGGYPSSPTDGTLALDNKVRNQHQANGLEIANLENNTPVYIQLFPYSTKNAVNSNEANRISGTPSAVPPGNVTGLAVKAANGKLTVSWTDPTDGVISGQNVTWAGTKIRYKAGSALTDENDGTLAVDSTTRDQYKTSGFEISGLTNGATYYIQAFPYSTDGAINRNSANQITGTPQAFRTMGVQIDYGNSNPQSAVIYIEDAVGMIPNSEAWDEFFGYYPCVLKNGVEGVRLNPNDFTKDVNGGSVNLASEAVGDVMICFPRRGYKIETVGNTLKVFITDDPNKPGFSYLAHQRGSANKDKLYIGAYVGYTQGGKLRSWSGKAPTVNQTIGTFRNQAKAGGAGYDLFAFYPLVLLQCMGILRMKSLDSQTSIGKGWTSQSAAATTGQANSRGMNWGERTGKHQVKFLGIEDFWGNVRQWIDGFFCNSNRNIMTATQNFNDNGSGYANKGRGANSDIGGWTSKVQGSSETGFIVKETSGSQTTYFSDYGHLSAGYLPVFGGHWSDGAAAGLFMLDVSCSASSSLSSVGARLMFL